MTKLMSGWLTGAWRRLAGLCWVTVAGSMAGCAVTVNHPVTVHVAVTVGMCS